MAMTTTARRGGRTKTAGQGARRLRRGSLTPEMIVIESLKLMDSGGFSLPKLGRALGADPTAVYRHFASRDELILAIADRLIEEAMAGFSPLPCWLDTIAESTRRLRATYRAHPAAAALSATRTTAKPAEMRIVNILIGAMFEAGFEGEAAVTAYRAIGDFALCWAGGEAAFLALDASQQKTDRLSWTRGYLAVDRAEYPHIWQVRDELAEVTDDAIFETILAVVIEGFRAIAPRPCTCAKHGGPDGQAT